eukprot:CAMPEP_0197695770 /NCGR_PEP_ID=MMETSP1338-20131121/115645_1 /TAXON_ID=43686 ORGANISM="Pelagodinium beii, Strain RCC1491" /NCGR_SAMPLE_ID=MMETSP1338 /ASSEMBLY_ACC=CAM_ASM_000754 /LENGTH=139 /DNA_ID=CAMNT_0043278795 /DNA_START=37 /DNA_END=452 /DNA_ORIENTATION=+
MSRVSLKVHVQSGSDLGSGDGYSLSDPFVVCLRNSNPEFQTKACLQTADPVWDEEHVIRDYTPGQALLFQVMDEDNAVKEALLGGGFLGEALLDGREFFPHGFDGEVRLENVPGGIPAVLRLSISVDDDEASLPIPQRL